MQTAAGRSFRLSDGGDKILEAPFEQLGDLVAITELRQIALRRSRQFRERCPVQPEVDQRVFVAAWSLARISALWCATHSGHVGLELLLGLSFERRRKRTRMSGECRSGIGYMMVIVRPVAGTIGFCATILTDVRMIAETPQRQDRRLRVTHQSCAAAYFPSPARGRKRHQFVVRPGPRAIRGHRAHLLHSRDVNRRSSLAPLAPDVGQHGGDLIVVQRRADRRHQADRAFLAVQQDARGHLRRRERERRTDEGGATRSWPRPSG